MDILIAGDLVPTQVNQSFFNSGDIKSLIGNELYPVWMEADFRIFNLETPLLDEVSPILKCGPNLHAPLSSIKGIKELNPSLVALANNHINDHGVEGLQSTKKVLSLNDIPFLGIGDTLNQASKPYILKYKNIKIGIYACAEHEFSIATDEIPGANPFDPLESLDHIKRLKSECDYIIVLYHGGKEHYRYPSPYLQKVCRKIVEKGADLVVCQHSHCIGCYENYNSSTIVYGQGNFIFNKYDNEYWNSSLLIKLNIKDEVNIEYIPIVKNEIGVSLATEQESKKILSDYEYRSKEITQKGFLDSKYQEFAQLNIKAYLRKISGMGKWLSRIDRRLFNGELLRKRLKKDQLLEIQNYIECEAHRELILTGLKGEDTIGR